MYVDPQNMSALDSKDFVAVALHFAILEIVDEEGLTTNLDGIGPTHAYANGKYLFVYIRKPIDTNGNFCDYVIVKDARMECVFETFFNYSLKQFTVDTFDTKGPFYDDIQDVYYMVMDKKTLRYLNFAAILAAFFI